MKENFLGFVRLVIKSVLALALAFGVLALALWATTQGMGGLRPQDIEADQLLLHIDRVAAGETVPDTLVTQGEIEFIIENRGRYRQRITIVESEKTALRAFLVQ